MKSFFGVISGLSFVIIAGVLLLANSQNQNNQDVLSEMDRSDGQLTVLSDSHDFGTISMRDGEVKHLYELKNESSEPVALGEIYTSCMCTSTRAIYSDGERSRIGGMRGHGAPVYLDKIIQPGEDFQIEAVFDPAAHGPSGTGLAHRSIYVRTNSNKLPQLELSFDANVTQ